MVVFGVILLVVAVVLGLFGRSQRNTLHAMNAVETFSSSMLGELYQRVSSSIGADALAEPCEVEGVIEVDAPLTAPLSGTPCVYYVLTVNREYEEDQTTTDAQGRTSTSTLRGSEQVQHDQRAVDFWVRDNDGRVLVRPEGADLDLRQSKEEFRPEPSGAQTIDFGPFSFQIPAATGRRRTLGYKAVEEILEVGTRVYVLGCAADHSGQVAVQQHRKHGRFMISRRSERDLANSAASTAKKLFYAAGGTGALGLVLVVMGLLQ